MVINDVSKHMSKSLYFSRLNVQILRVSRTFINLQMTIEIKMEINKINNHTCRNYVNVYRNKIMLVVRIVMDNVYKTNLYKITASIILSLRQV